MATATMKVTGIDASYYLVKDLDRSTKFYVDLLGAEPTMHHPEMISEWTFPGGETFGLYKSAEFHPSGGVMFAVPDVPAAIETCKARGVKFDDNGEVTDTPACHMAFARDTEGNGFILHHRKG